jgi:hypothetical protein
MVCAAGGAELQSVRGNSFISKLVDEQAHRHTDAFSPPCLLASTISSLSGCGGLVEDDLVLFVGRHRRSSSISPTRVLSCDQLSQPSDTRATGSTEALTSSIQAKPHLDNQSVQSSEPSASLSYATVFMAIEVQRGSASGVHPEIQLSNSHCATPDQVASVAVSEHQGVATCPEIKLPCEQAGPDWGHWLHRAKQTRLNPNAPQE